MSGRPWEVDFVAVSAALGEPMTVVTEALGDAGTARAAELVRALQASKRSARATTLATALAAVASDLERLRLR